MEDGVVADSHAFSGIIWNLNKISKMLLRHPAEWSCSLVGVFVLRAHRRDVDSEGDNNVYCMFLGPWLRRFS